MSYLKFALAVIVALVVFFGAEVGGFLLCTGPLNIHGNWVFLASAVFNFVFLPLYLAAGLTYLHHITKEK